MTRSEQARAWRESHPEQMRAYKRKHYLKYRDQIIARTKARYDAMAPEQRKKIGMERLLRAEYGIDTARYEAMLREQEGRCFLCKRPPKADGLRLHVDHDHKTGEVRRLLCMACNTFLGRIERDPGWLDRVKFYLGLDEQK